MSGRPDRRHPEVPGLLAYGVRQAGNLTGLPRETLAKLVRLGLAEHHPYRTSAGRASRPDIHQGARLTRQGFAEAASPWRAGRINLAFGKPDSGGWTLTLLVHPAGLRVALVPMHPTANRPINLPAFVPPDPVVEEHTDPAEAARGLRVLATYAEGMTGGPGRVHDPGHLAWDGAVVSLEDVAALDAGEGPDVEEVLDRIDAALAPGAPGPRR